MDNPCLCNLRQNYHGGKCFRDTEAAWSDVVIMQSGGVRWICGSASRKQITIHIKTNNPSLHTHATWL